MLLMVFIRSTGASDGILFSVRIAGFRTGSEACASHPEMPISFINNGAGLLTRRVGKRVFGKAEVVTDDYLSLPIIAPSTRVPS